MTLIRTNTFPTDSLFDSLFDPFFASATTPIKKTFSTNTHVSNENDKYIISVAAPGEFCKTPTAALNLSEI